MLPIRKTFLTALLLLDVLSSIAQVSANEKFVPDFKRLLFHDNIDKAQQKALAANKQADSAFHVLKDEFAGILINEAIIQTVDSLQFQIESDSSLSNNSKIGYLRGVENLLNKYSAACVNRRLDFCCLATALETFEKAMKADEAKNSVEPFISWLPYEEGRLVLESKAFNANAGFNVSKQTILNNYISQHPDEVFAVRKENSNMPFLDSLACGYASLHADKIFEILKANPDLPFQDSLIRVAGHKYPRLLYDFAAAKNDLGRAIGQVNDPLVKTVYQMAQSRNGQFYFAFLDDILNGCQTMASINAVKDDNLKYYRLLVNTRLNYIKRLQNGEHVWEMDALAEMLRKRVNDVYIKTINALYETGNPALRFRILQPLTAQELYYLAVFGENEIYTAGFEKGIYPLMMQKTGNRGDLLMESVGFDKFKKFVKMSACYNTLNNFLGSYPNQEQAKSLMASFVNGLESSEGLEDGIDVADSYINIYETNKELAQSMLALTQQNYERLNGTNRHGAIIYNLLNKLFQSADSTSSINLSQEFGIPAVYKADYSSLVDSLQRVVVQVFFYGDKDGQNIFQDFLRQFSSSTSWKITDDEKWVTVNSIEGKPVSIFANKPLPDRNKEDEQAQKALNKYLSDKGLQPAIVIHRGHSYNTSRTIEQIQPSAKIVFLGSCGGYHLIHDVLKHAPDAHIIATKQIGKSRINMPFTILMAEKLRNGNDIEWVPFWREFENAVTVKDGFEDYIPPYKNLGALFIKAYNQAVRAGETAKK